jgi:hypothetical protein
MAQRYGVALICVMHLNKSNMKAIYRVMGSLGFLAAARAAFLVSEDPLDPTGNRRLLICAKLNVAEKPASLAFATKDEKVVFEDKSVNITADEVLGGRSNIEAPERDRAVEWLKQLLSGVDSMPSKEIFKLAEENMFNERMLARARKELGIKCFPDFDEEGNKSWYWRLPGPDGDKPKLPTLSEMYARLNKMKKNMTLSKISTQ